MSNKLVTIFLALAIIGALLGYLILRAAVKADIYTLAPIGIGLILFLIVMFLIFRHLDKRNHQSSYSDFRNDLEKNYEKISITLDDFHIQSNNWNERINHGSERIPDFKEDTFHSVHISQTIRYKGRNLAIEKLLEIDPIVLKMKFALQKTTILYIKNPDDHYLDLDFLYS